MDIHIFPGIMAIIPAKEGITDYQESNATFVPLLRSKNGYYSGAVNKKNYLMLFIDSF